MNSCDCRQWLANKGVNPNSGTEPYTNPTASELQERENKLERWKREIEYLEWEARAYVNTARLTIFNSALGLGKGLKGKG
ncbi:MAG: hypothetical protein RMY28_026340 [Nostoc sp. ChiSLP01]|nr:hypothetical protein [Nostoc sp. CmiSLP01]MDZ8283861.1 hypothetical protein [Nostoc sp. ChiSLP01]